MKEQNGRNKYLKCVLLRFCLNGLQNDEWCEDLTQGWATFQKINFEFFRVHLILFIFKMEDETREAF